MSVSTAAREPDAVGSWKDTGERRLLVLAPSYPFPPRDGVQLRLCNLLRRLGEDVRITLVVPDRVERRVEEVVETPFRGKCVRIPHQPAVTGWRASSMLQVLRPEASMIWKFYSPEFAREVRTQAASVNALLAVGLQMGQYLSEVPAGVPTALDNYNVESRILSRMAETRPGLKRFFWLGEAAKLRRTERRLMERAGTVFAISEVDREGLREISPRARLRTVPMGIDLDYFAPAPETAVAVPPRFTFVGVMNWHVNEDAAGWLCERIWPRIRQQVPGAELFLVGRDPSPTVTALGQGPSVTVTGTVPDVRPYLHASTALLVPLRYGSGVRTKILEAFAAGRPVVSTAVGAEGLDVRDGEHLLLADTEEEFARACIRLATDRKLAQRLSVDGRAFAEEQDRAATRRLHAALAEAYGWETPGTD